MSGFEPVGSDIKWQGAIITAGVATYRYSDGRVVTRDKVWHPGAVGILAVDDTRVWLTRQSQGLPVRNRVLSPAYVRVSTERAQRYVMGSPSPVCVQAKRAAIPNHRAPIGPI